MEKKSLIGLSKTELLQEFCGVGLEAYRARQIWNWIYCHGKSSFDSMDNISKAIKARLSESYTISRSRIKDKLVSRDGTCKWLLEFCDGATVEMVYIPEEDRGTLCLSSQVGCAMNCRFCNTGRHGFVRHMTSEEIVQQVLIARDELGEWDNLSKKIGCGRMVSNIVMMGMGEPLANYDNVVKSLRIINDPDGIAFSNRRITLSTCGLVPQINKLATDIKVNLAISLHASNDAVRKILMPVAQQWSIEDIMTACQTYAKSTGDRRITFEYIMINGLNDSDKDALQLISLVRKYKIPAKFNLIPFNEWNGCDFKPSPPDRVKTFARFITDATFPCPIRKARGQDIMAACGQLKNRG